jgi:predicted metal-binding membrane protein
MMLPSTLPAVRHVAFNTMRYRRRRAVAGYVTGYLAVWIAFGTPALALMRLAGTAGIDERWLFAGIVVVALSWQLTPWKRRALVGCRRTVPLPPVGRRADAACVRFAVAHAWRCMVSCWPLMLMTAMVGHLNLIAMTVVTMVVVVEERNMVRNRIQSIAGVVATAAGVVLLV